MKAKNDSKSNKLDGKKLTTAQAIAQTLTPKRPKYIKPLEKSPNIPESINNLNTLPNKELKSPPKTLTQQPENITQPIDNLTESEKVYINVVYNSNNSSTLKDILTDRELRFIGHHFAGEQTVLNAMKLAGYVGYSDAYLYRLARNLVQRYESQAEDHRIIFRAMGAGETFVANGLIELAKSSKSDMVKLNAYAQIAKILGLTKEQLEGAGGVTIIFEGAGAPGATASLPGAPLPPSQGEIKVLPASNKPMMITK